MTISFNAGVPLDAVSVAVGMVSRGQPSYETVAASATDQVLGGAGAVGDYINHLVIVPATTSAGTVSIKDGAGSAINVFVTGTLSNLTPIIVPLSIRSTAGAWSVTTGAAVSVIAIGKFSA